MIFMRINAVVNLNPLVGSKLVKNGRRALKSLTSGLLRYLKMIGCCFRYFSSLLKLNLNLAVDFYLIYQVGHKETYLLNPSSVKISKLY